MVLYTKQVAQIGEGQGRLSVTGRHLHHLVDAVGAIDHGKFRMQAQMNEHALIVGNCPLDTAS